LRFVPLLRLPQRRFDPLHKRLETCAEELGADPLQLIDRSLMDFARRIAARQRPRAAKRVDQASGST
jgi:hypothetical protein